VFGIRNTCACPRFKHYPRSQSTTDSFIVAFPGKDRECVFPSIVFHRTTTNRMENQRFIKAAGRDARSDSLQHHHQPQIYGQRGSIADASTEKSIKSIPRILRTSLYQTCRRDILIHFQRNGFDFTTILHQTSHQSHGRHHGTSLTCGERSLFSGASSSRHTKDDHTIVCITRVWHLNHPFQCLNEPIVGM
jgi:hypothetical protein